MGFIPFFSVETWTLLITCIILFVVHGYWTYGIFEKLGIPGHKPYMYIGTIGRGNKIYYFDDNDCAQKFGRVWGMYEFRKPALVVMDPDMLKTILVKESFTYFTNRRNLNLKGDLYDAVSFVEDDQWKRIRSILSPSFSSGRIKEMFSIMKHHSRKLTDNLQYDEVIQIKDFFGPYSVDATVSIAIGVDMESKASSPIISHAAKLFRFPPLLFLVQAWVPVLVPLMELLHISFFPKSSTDFIKKIVAKIREERNESSSQNSKDVLQYLINSQTANEGKSQKKGNYHTYTIHAQHLLKCNVFLSVLTGLTDHEILSQVGMFIFAGYDTSASTLTFLAYNLARNPEVMKRLQKEIDVTFPNKGPVQYEDLMQMEYLDCVINESLRLYPVVARLERVAKESVKIKGVSIPKGMLVIVPVYALHRDPELWPQPEEFRPERFSKENKQSIKPYTYMPFGAGPRNCLGMRLALVMIKLVLVEVLQNCSFSVCEETEVPLTMDPQGLMGSLRPIKLKLVKRE
ncbi:cytochrome P450 3A30-like [Embiotoca jacksoni]|uniref:cytochrome P450 3A30-like n=1 Tax=Embiotoca jacksoni TaxID=100190 RepID=UPI0037043A2C